MDEYDYNSYRMENEYETVTERAPMPISSVSENNEGRYYRETIKPKSEKGTFKKFVAVAVICALVGAPLLGLAMGAGQTLAESYLNQNKQVEAAKQDESVALGTTEYAAGNAAKEPAAAVPANSIVDVVKSAQASVVNITTSIMSNDRFFSYYFGNSRPAQGLGTGIIFRQDDENVYIMTNYHVIENASSAYISFDNNEQVPARPVGYDKEEDVAIIMVKKADLQAEGIDNVSVATLGDSSTIEVGEWVVAIGNAVGNGKTVTYGIISGLNKEVAFSDGRLPVNLIQTDAAINQGNSGGALVNMRGEVIGMNTAKLAGYTIESMGFALPINSIIEIVEPIMGDSESRLVSRPFIGISGLTLTESLAKEYGLIVSEGVILSEVFEGGGASDAGLRQNDIIIEFDEQKIKTIEELQTLISSKEIGSKVNAKIIRNNQKELEVIIVISDAAEVNPW